MKISKLNKTAKTWIISISIVVFSFGFYSFYDNDFEIAKNLDIFYTLFREVNLYYVDDTDPGELIKKGIEGMLKSLDPYTNYISEARIEDYRFLTTGQYGGIGALMKMRGNKVQVTEPYENSPAIKAGLKAGDLITEINGNNLKGKSFNDIGEIVKGQANTEVTFLIERQGTPKPFEKTVIREKIEMKVVPHYQMLNDSIGYIKFTSFTRTAYSEVQAAVQDLKDNSNMKSLVFDLRGNPGGLLIEAVKIMNLFVEGGQEIVSTNGKVKSRNHTYKTKEKAYDTSMPIAVLVNSKSASASEIVSGSMQDLDRGVIIGTRSFGKGLVQTTRDLSYNTKLKVTTAKYYIPSGRCIQALNYSQRNPDGSVGHVPDSLITEFKTKSGRLVYDGGGILPDIIIEKESISKITAELYIKDLIFDYVTQYCLEHDSVPPASKFIFSDYDYKEFKAFVVSHDFIYKTLSEEFLQELKKIAEKEKYLSKSKNEFAALEKILSNDLDRDIEIFKDEIKQLISEEILQRYHYKAGKVSYSLNRDAVVKKAVEVLSNKKQYNEILKH